MSFWCAPALMRVIHSRRKSRFLFLRSRYAYFHPRSTVSFAGRHSLLRAPKAPRAAFITSFFRLHQALHALGVTGGRDEPRLAEPTLPLRGLLRQDVTLECLEPAHLAG